MKAILILALALSLTSCDHLRTFVINNEATIETALVEGARIGARAGIDRIKRDAKQPVPPVQP